MTKRLNGASGQYERDPYDWYREGPAPVEVLFDAIDFRDDLIYDPSCGGGNILDVAKRRGHPTFGSDIVDRHPRHPFQRGNFLMATRFPTSTRALSIVNNPPYGYIKGIGEQFVHKTLDDVPFRLAAFLLPIEFACSVGRHERLYAKRPPAYVAFLSERPSMPPGELVSVMGADAYKGGMADYVWLVWRAGPPTLTQALFLPPWRGPAHPSSQRRIRRGSQSPSVSARHEGMTE